MKRQKWVLSLTAAWTLQVANAQITTETDSTQTMREFDLDEIVVVTQTPVVRLKTDKVTYQVSNDADAKTRSVLEMLRKVPMVTVDGKNNITVNGSEQFKVYVDGRLNTSITRNPSKMLRNMPANNIRNIEVVTNPGAQYDAEGAGGVLCIYTKKGEAKTAILLSEEEAESATDGYVHAITGLRSWGADISLSHQSGPWSWDINLNGEYWDSPDASMESEMVGNSGRQYMKQQSTSKMPGTMGDFDIGYEIDSVRSLHANISLNWFGMKDSGTPTYLYSGGMWGTDMDFGGHQSSEMNEMGIDGSIDYQCTRDDHGRMLINYQISSTPSNNDTEVCYTDLPSLSVEMMRILSNKRSEVREHSTAHHLMSDFTISLAEGHLLNTGVKMTANISDSNSKETIGEEPTTQQKTTISKKYCTHFRQYQYIAAAYAEWDARWGWLGMKNGFRYEHTWQRSEYLKGDGIDFSLNYGAIVPSVSLSASVSESNTFGLNYNIRIRRPRINELDPYVNRTDPTQISYGNPKLDAQHLHNVAFVYTLSASQLALRMSLGQAWSDDGISQYSLLKEKRIHTTFGNVQSNRTTTLNTFLSWGMTSMTRVSIHGSLSYSDMRSRQLDAFKCGWSGSANVGLLQSLPWQLKWTTDFEWMSRRQTLQGYSTSMTMLSTTLIRSFCHDRWNIALSGMTGLGHGGKMVWRSVSRTKDFTNSMSFTDSMHDITLGVTYTFGGTTHKADVERQTDSDFEINDESSSRQIRRMRR